MTSTKLEIFLHLPGTPPKVVHAEPKETLKTFLSRIGIGDEDINKFFVFVGECDHTPTEIETTHKPVDLNQIIADLELEKHHHLHCSHCREIDTNFYFLDKELNAKFFPATTIGETTRWARSNFRFDEAAASEHVLQISGTQEQPRPSQHLGELVKKGNCRLSFEIVKEMIPQG